VATWTKGTTPSAPVWEPAPTLHGPTISKILQANGYPDIAGWNSAYGITIAEMIEHAETWTAGNSPSAPVWSDAD
jgi:hypothetical protein